MNLLLTLFRKDNLLCAIVAIIKTFVSFVSKYLHWMMVLFLPWFHKSYLSQNYPVYGRGGDYSCNGDHFLVSFKPAFTLCSISMHANGTSVFHP